MGTDTLGSEVSIALSREFGIELYDASTNMLYFKEFTGRRVPRLERHAFKKVEDSSSIHAVGFTALHAGCGEVLEGFWVHHHDLDVRRVVECDGQG